MLKDDLLLQEKCANVLICLQNIASKNYRSAVNVPFYMDKAKEVEKLDLSQASQALDELMDICGHSRKYKNIIHLLNEVYESVEAVKQSREED